MSETRGEALGDTTTIPLTFIEHLRSACTHYEEEAIMHSRIQLLVNAAQELATQWIAVVERWGTAELPDSTPYARLHGATFSEFNQRVTATLDLASATGSMDEASQLLFLPRVDRAMKHLDSARTSVAQLLAELNAQPEAIFRDPNQNLDGIQGFLNGSHVTNANAGSHLDQVSASTHALFDLITAGMKFGKVKGFTLYQQYGRQLTELANTARKLHEEVLSFRNATEALQVEALASAGEASSSAKSAEEARSASVAASTAAKNAQSEAEAKLAAIRETAKAAASLETQVETYAASFDAFQKSLDTRVDQHSAFEKDMQAALVANKEREAEIDRLSKKADSMIQGATTAGLGDSLEKTRVLYQRRMVGAGLGFFVSILLLAASAVPLVAHILPGLFLAWLPQATLTPLPNVGGNGDAWLSLLGKIFLMFPATWLTQFFSKAYSEFFHLEREYAHKAALARSVEGFKKQAPKYEEEISTAVFFEVQSNPSKQQAPDAAEHPILGPLMKKFIDALPLGKASSPEKGDS